MPTGSLPQSMTEIAPHPARAGKPTIRCSTPGRSPKHLGQYIASPGLSSDVFFVFVNLLTLRAAIGTQKRTVLALLRIFFSRRS